MPDLDQTYGAALVGLLFAAFFQGVLTVQAYIYYEAFPEDPWGIKLLVAGVWTLDTFHLALIGQAVYHYLVTNWGNTPELMTSTWELDIHLAIVGLASIVCQLFFLHRIWIFSNKNKIMTAILGCMCLTSLGLNMNIAVKLIRIHSISQNAPHGTGPFGAPTSEAIAAFCLGATVDVILAFLLCYYLRRGRSGFEKTNSIIARVMQYTIATGLLTSLYAFACVIMYFAIPHTFIFIAMHFSLGRLYTNALLVTLNFRRSLRAGLYQPYPNSRPSDRPESLGFGPRSTETYLSGLNEQGLSVHKAMPGISVKLDSDLELQTRTSRDKS